MRSIVVMCALVVGVGSALVQPAVTFAQDPQSWHDYNHDSIPDLAVGVPGETINGQAGAGAVQVFYGAPNNAGLKATGQQFFSEASLILSDGASAGDNFGAALASGDFDGDGITDLAIGIPGDDLEFAGGSDPDRGAVTMLWGSTSGLVEDTSVQRDQGGQTGQQEGRSLVALDMFNAHSTDPTLVDNIADLAITAGSGRVIIEPGGSRQFLAISTPDRRVIDTAFNDDTKKLVLAQGNIDSDAPAELLVGMPGVPREVNGVVVEGAGAFVIINRVAGTATTGLAQQTFFQEDFGLVSERGDNFGASLATGQLVGTGTANEELVVGIPGQDVVFNGANRDQAGMAMILVVGGSTTVSEATAGVPDNPERGDRFAQSLAIGHFRDDDGDDIAYGVPGEKIGTKDGAGAVIVQYHSNTNVFALLSQKTIGIPGTIASNDNFGASLAAGNFNRDEVTDLAIGVPMDNEPSALNNAGAVNVVYSDGAALTARAGDTLWSQGNAGVYGAPGVGDKFGFAIH